MDTGQPTIRWWRRTADRLAALQRQVDKLDAYFDKLDAYVDTVDGELTRVTRQVDTLDGQVDTLAATLTELVNDLARGHGTDPWTAALQLLVAAGDGGIPRLAPAMLIVGRDLEDAGLAARANGGYVITDVGRHSLAAYRTHHDRIGEQPGGGDDAPHA